MLFDYGEFLKGIDREAYHEGEWQWEEDGYTVTRTYTYSAPGCHDAHAAGAEQHPRVHPVEQAAGERQPHEHDVGVYGHEQRHLSHIGLALGRDQAELQRHRHEEVAHDVEHQTHAAGHHHAHANEDEPSAMEPLLFFYHFSYLSLADYE